MKRMLVIAMCSLLIQASWGQKYFTKSGRINFDATSQSSPERVEAVNRNGTCVLDSKTGNIQFAVLMKGFEFEKALMQEHFNENYVESEKYPRAEFRGVISNNSAVNYSKDGIYPVNVKGVLSMHGEAREITSEGKLVIQNGKLNATTDFIIGLKDYRISIPGLVADKISNTARISISCSLELFKG